MRSLRVAVVLAFVAAAGWATTREVVLSLPLRSKLQLSGHERLYIGPFVREVRGDEAPAQLKFDVAAEFERFLRKLLRKESKLVILPQLEGVRVPTTDPLELATLADFWRELGMRVNADYVVAGSIEFTVQDTTQPKMESYESPIDGRTYYRQVMVEQTGFSYDILLNIFDARSGALLLQESFKDTQEREEKAFDELTGMFANLYALENKLAGVFVPRTVKSKRFLFVP
ncbi:MAG: hypothetical protein KA072_00340 [Thermoanaerobaculaceae bacterium]|nr:hypothetical protein [Thermoanaerobaculaceae bacterium]MDI9621300.1 hypothetical protein [Acidobacteriota bacterium]NLH09812.1 hypothetical protein [Holophagae bacterium]HPW54168.1 hypothetical protein [Thermoanaerobaculaceae bacterium]